MKNKIIISILIILLSISCRKSNDITGGGVIMEETMAVITG